MPCKMKKQEFPEYYIVWNGKKSLGSQLKHTCKGKLIVNFVTVVSTSNRIVEVNFSQICQGELCSSVLG